MPARAKPPLICCHAREGQAPLSPRHYRRMILRLPRHELPFAAASAMGRRAQVRRHEMIFCGPDSTDEAD